MAPYLFNYGTEEQKMRYLPEMTSGECITCIGMTEPSGGSDLQAMKTFAKKDGDDYILNGSKVKSIYIQISITFFQISIT